MEIFQKQKNPHIVCETYNERKNSLHDAIKIDTHLLLLKFLISNCQTCSMLKLKICYHWNSINFGEQESATFLFIENDYFNIKVECL